VILWHAAARISPPRAWMKKNNQHTADRGKSPFVAARPDDYRLHSAHIAPIQLLHILIYLNNKNSRRVALALPHPIKLML